MIRSETASLDARRLGGRRGVCALVIAVGLWGASRCGSAAAPPAEPVPELPAAVTDLQQAAQEQADQRHFQEALALAQRALELALADAGLDPVNHARLIEETANLEIALGRYGEAESRYREALDLRERRQGLLSPDLVRSLQGVALALAGEKRFPEAEPLLLRAESLAAADTRHDGSALITVLAQLGYLYVALGKPEETERITRRMVTLASKAVRESQGTPAAGVVPSGAAGTGESAGAAEEALGFSLGMMNRFLAAAESDPSMPGVPKMRVAQHWLQALSLEDKHPEQVEGEERQALALAVSVLGPRSPETISALTGLGAWQLKQGQLGSAEELFRQALALLEGRSDLAGSDLGYTLDGLARVLELGGRLSDAAELYGRAAEALRQRLGEVHPFVANALWKRAVVEQSLGHEVRSQELAAQAGALYERALPTGHPFRNGTLASRRATYDEIERTAVVSDAAGRLVTQYTEEVSGHSAPAAADELVQQAAGCMWSARFTEARERLDRALEIRAGILGELHPLTLDVRLQIAWLDRAAKRGEAGLENARRLTAGLQSRLLLTEQPDPGSAVREQRTGRASYLAHLGLLLDTYGRRVLTAPALRTEAFEQSQLAVASRTAQAFRGTVIRMAAAGGRRGRLASRLHRHLERRERLDLDLLKAAGLPAEQRDLDREAALRGERAAVGTSLVATGSALARSFARYSDLVSPRPVGVAATQRSLGSDEAMLFYVVDAASSYVWVVRHGAIFLETLVGQQVLEPQVARLRRSLQLAGVEQQIAGGQAPAFDVADAAALGRELIVSVGSHLGGVHHLILVLDGPLAALPFATLIVGSPDSPAQVPYPQLPWLVRKFSLSVLPAVSSLSELRGMAARSRAPRAFLGVGRPLAVAAAADQKPDQGVAAGEALAAARALRDATELNDAKAELEEIAETLGTPGRELRLGHDATRAALHTLPLRQFRTVAFATHALVSGEGDAEEPALVLSAAGGEPAGSALLTAGEITQLNFDADLVLLSACNTAAADGSPEAEVLSGLARSFLLAGSRALIVSHWEVPSQSTSRLTVEVFRVMRRAHLGVAEALRRAMIEMIDRPERPELAHPVFWGAFIVVGKHTATAR